MKKLQKAFNNLRKSHKKIRKVFSKIDDSLIETLLGDYNSPKLRRSLRKNGDGYILHGAPRTIDELIAADAIVLIVMNSPFLGADSDFNPTTPLHKIPYWRDKGLESEARSTQSGRECSLHFMTWQQDCEVHGEDTRPKAIGNRKLLVKNEPSLDALFQEGKETSTRFIKCCKDWAESNKKPFLVITNSRKNFNKSISSFLADAKPENRFSTNVFAKKNGRIMEWIRGRLP